jgi:hypothetical protein
MKTESLIYGLADIMHNRIALEAILDMAPGIIEKLQLLTVQQISNPQTTGTGKVYIAGKVSNMKRFEALYHFNQAETHLKAAGFKVVNPMKLVDPSASWEAAMKICITALLTNCDKICLLDNWRQSKGAVMEYSLAKALSHELIDLAATLKIAL